MKKYYLERDTIDRVSGWIVPNEDGTSSSLCLMVNDHVVGRVSADKYRKDLVQVSETGQVYFDIRLKFNDEKYKPLLPEQAEFSIVDEETGMILSKHTLSGASKQGQFANEFHEELTYYHKGGGFYIPLSARSEEWWKSISIALHEVFSRAEELGVETQIAYGTLLGHVREKGFVAHDDDIDLVLLCGEHAGSVQAAIVFSEQVVALAGSRPIRLDSNGQAHIHFSLDRNVSLDLFAAWTDRGKYFQNFTVAGTVSASDVIPAREDKFLGVRVKVPNKPESVLNVIYGPNWQVPDHTFTWSRAPEVADYFRPIHNYNREVNKGYWDEYYNTSNAKVRKMPPSQFAVFVTDFLHPDDLIVEFGCGTGRDSFFFVDHGWRIMAADYSDTVIETNSKNAESIPGCLIDFTCCNVEDITSVNTFVGACTNSRTNRIVFYSRFFLHAIEESGAFIMRKMIDSHANSGDLVALEFRVQGDENRPKETDKHYRRYVDAQTTIDEWAALGWKLVYDIIGTGLAKYKQDDALVCRFVLAKD